MSCQSHLVPIRYLIIHGKLFRRSLNFVENRLRITYVLENGYLLTMGLIATHGTTK